MVEAVAGRGYDAVTVRQVIALAGVSRRSFYEQFASKQDCFLSTYDRSRAGSWRPRTRPTAALRKDVSRPRSTAAPTS